MKVMAFYNRNGDRKRTAHDFRRHEEEVVRSLCRLGSRPISPRSMQEEEKRIRREIANSNERRRMQSINAGFQFLRNLLPQREGEKLSKASILQQTADYIYQLEQEKTCLLEQNCQLKRRVINSQNNQDSDGSCSDSPFPKRKKRGDSVDEGLGGSSPASNDGNVEDMKRELSELKFTLERERSLRLILEEQIRNLESQVIGSSEKAYNAALQDHLSYHSSPESLKNSRIMNMVSDDIGSPQSSLSEMDSSHEMSHRQFSPEYSHEEVPEDLSGRNNPKSVPSVHEVSACSMPSLPGVLPPHVSPPAFTIELEVTSQQETYKPSRSRQNLETIVEAIRHLEGDHMFRDDPSPSERPVSKRKDSERTVKKELCDELPHKTQHNRDQTISLQHQIIRNAPVSQSRPGVIVSKLL